MQTLAAVISERNNIRKVNKTGHNAHGIITEVDN